MDRKRVLQVLTALGGGFIAVSVLFGALLVARSVPSLSHAAASAPYAWLLPLSAGLVIFGVAWALSTQPPRASERVTGPHSLPCGSCGKTVFGDWRICPYCGCMLEPAEAGAHAHSNAV